MEEAALQAFEERAAEAEERLTALEAKISAGGGATSTGASADTQKYAKALQEIRRVLVTAKTEQEELQAKYDEATEAAKKMETENSKLKYQVLHLKRSLQEADEKLLACK